MTPDFPLPTVVLTRESFLEDHQGRRFSDVVNSPEQHFEALLEELNDTDTQRRMEESEIYHDRPALAGVIRQLEAHPAIDGALADSRIQKSKRLRQAVGVAVRIIMEGRGWETTGRKGSLGVRAEGSPTERKYNKGGLSFWFVRAERYKRRDGMPFRSVRQRYRELHPASPESPNGKPESRP